MKKFSYNPFLSSQQTFRFVTDEGTAVVVTLRWNGRSNFWFLDVTQTLADGTTSSFYGVKVVASFPLLRAVQSLFAFPGDFIVFPASSGVVGQPIAFPDLGSQWFLCYLNATEIAAWKVQNGVQ